MLNYSKLLPSVTATLLALSSTYVMAQSPVSLDSAIDELWATDQLWDDGKAEVATYEGHKTIYGKDRVHTHRLITVKEDFNMDYYVKADWPYRQKPIMPIIKQNQVATIETPNYPYHMMASVFFERNDLENCVKLSVATQEWCGITNKEFALYDEPTITYMSYWDGQGTGSESLNDYGKNVVFEEELPLLVRALKHENKLEAEFKLYPNQTYTQVNPGVAPTPALLKVESYNQTLEVPSQVYDENQLWKVTVSTEAAPKDMEFFVNKEEPHTLVSYDFGDGRKYLLQEIERWAYWEISE